MLRKLIKTGVASAVHWSGTNNLLALRPAVKQMPLVLGYHRVVEDFRASAQQTIAPMLISVRTFERQLDWIGRRYEYVSLDDLADAMEGKKHFKKPVAAITFDDGYADTYQNAWPVLKRKGIPWAVFVVTDLIGTKTLQVYDELYLLLSRAYPRWREPRKHLAGLLLALETPVSVLRRIETAASDSLHATWALMESLPQYTKFRLIETLRNEVEIETGIDKQFHSMDWEMLREMSTAGVTIGSHTRTHAFLTRESWNRVLDETRGSREELQRRLGRPVDHFAYPSGAFDTGVVSAVASSGYRCAYTTCRHRDIRYPALTIPRRLLWENSSISAFGGFSPAVMNCQVNGVFDLVPSCHQAHSF